MKATIVRPCVALMCIAAFVAPGSAAANHSIIEHVSTGPMSSGNQDTGAAQYYASADGRRVLFFSDEQLTPGDNDAEVDLFIRANGTTTRIAHTSPFPHAAFSRDGAVAAFPTVQQLVPDDLDAEIDVYTWQSGTYTRVSTGPTGGNGPYKASLEGLSADGSRVAFTTREPLVASDLDSEIDAYARSGSTTEHISTGPTGGNGPVSVDTPNWIRLSGDGTRAYFTTVESLVAGDVDSARDLYVRAGGVTTLVSTGPSGGNGPHDVFAFYQVPRAGTNVVFETAEALVPADTDSAPDVYERAGGTTNLVSTGPTGGNGPQPASMDDVSADGQTVAFETSESLVPADTDSQIDSYVRAGGTTTLRTIGPTGGNGPYDVSGSSLSGIRLSADGNATIFVTAEALVGEDTNGDGDLYMRSGGTTTLISKGRQPRPQRPCVEYDECPFLISASNDASRVFFFSYDGLGPPPSPGSRQWEYTGGQVFAMPGAWNGIASEDGTRFVFATHQKLLSGDTDGGQLASDVYSIAEGTGYPRPKGATPTQVPLVPAYRQCTTPNRTHGPPLAFPACSALAQTSDELTVGTPDSNGKPAKSRGLVSYEAIVGNPSTPADEADVRITVELVDVYEQGSLADYAGELSARTVLRITDKLNPPTSAGPGTVTDTTLRATVPCTATADTTEGASCNVVTTADSLVPGTVTESRRSIWALGQVQVEDGGADDDADTAADNTLFLNQGIFVP